MPQLNPLPGAPSADQINDAALKGAETVAGALLPAKYQALFALIEEEEPVVFHLVSALVAHIKSKK